jgi:hypothetical protein
LRISNCLRVRGVLVVLQQLVLGEQGHWLLDHILHVGDLQQVNRVAGQDDLDAGGEDVDTVLNAGLVLVVLVLQVAADLVARFHPPPLGVGQDAHVEGQVEQLVGGVVLHVLGLRDRRQPGLLRSLFGNVHAGDDDLLAEVVDGGVEQPLASTAGVGGQ